MALIEELEDQGNLLFRYRSYIPIVFLASGLGVYAYKINDMSYPDLGFNYWIICLAVGLLGLLVRIYTVVEPACGTVIVSSSRGEKTWRQLLKPDRSFLVALPNGGVRPPDHYNTRALGNGTPAGSEGV